MIICRIQSCFYMMPVDHVGLAPNSQEAAPVSCHVPIKVSKHIIIVYGDLK